MTRAHHLAPSLLDRAPARRRVPGWGRAHQADGATRRRFLVRILEATALAVGVGRTAASPPSPQARLTVIDTHTHFYDPTRPQGVPWPPPNDPGLYRRVLPADYRALPVPSPVTGTVVVEASPWLEDNQWVLDLAARESFIVGFVGNLPVGRPGFAGSLKRFAAQPLFRGIRLRDRKLEGALEDPAFAGDLKRLADLGLSLDLVGGQEILPFAAALAHRLPGLRLILDHLAGVTVDGKPPPASWIDQMRLLARQPQVYCKLSGLVEGTGRTNGSAPHDVAFYRPVLDAMVTTFGLERLLYASNWPVSERFAPLGTVQGIIEDYFHDQGTQALAQVFGGNARTAYRLSRS